MNTSNQSSSQSDTLSSLMKLLEQEHVLKGKKEEELLKNVFSEMPTEVTTELHDLYIKTRLKNLQEKMTR